MQRREFLSWCGSAGAVGLAGCTDAELQESSGGTSLVENRPEAVYYPTHVDGMQLTEVRKDGAYKCILAYTFPHRFWLVTGDRKNKVELNENDSMHLMPVVWHQETGIVPADLNPQVRVRLDGEAVTSLSPWPMLSQPMGFHFGDNVRLPEEATYQIEVSVGDGSVNRAGILADAGPASFTFSLEYSQAKMDDITYRNISEEKQGTKGAVSPMKMNGLPSTQLPKPSGLPGSVRGTVTSGDGKFVVTTLDDATRFDHKENEVYLAVSARTPYNRYPLPLMSLSAIQKRSSEIIYDNILQPRIDSNLGYHYGAAVSDVESGDELTITIDALPQTARHEGYETAFFEMPEMTLKL